MPVYKWHNLWCHKLLANFHVVYITPVNKFNATWLYCDIVTSFMRQTTKDTSLQSRPVFGTPCTLLISASWFSLISASLFTVAYFNNDKECPILLDTCKHLFQLIFSTVTPDYAGMSHQSSINFFICPLVMRMLLLLLTHGNP